MEVVEGDVGVEGGPQSGQLTSCHRRAPVPSILSPSLRLFDFVGNHSSGWVCPV